MFISIIIPTINRADLLEQTISTIIKNNKQFTAFEIIVVDNGSTDNTQMLCKKLQQEYSFFTYYYDNTPGLLTGRHLGANKAKGNILAFIDDDILVSDTWLTTIYQTMNTRNDIDFLTGPNLPFYHSYPPAWLQYFWTKDFNGKHCGWLSLLDFGKEIKEISPNYVWGLNFIIRKNTFITLGGFHPDNIAKQFQHFQGDGETGLTMKAMAKNIKALYHPAAMVYHQVPTSRMSFEYFDNRAFYQGVCNSFTDIRLKNGLGININECVQQKTSLYKKIKNYTKHKIKKLILTNKNATPQEVIELFDRFNKKLQEGYQFHQEAYHTNPLVQQWTLQENYFNYKLPH